MAGSGHTVAITLNSSSSMDLFRTQAYQMRTRKKTSDKRVSASEPH